MTATQSLNRLPAALARNRSLCFVLIVGLVDLLLFLLALTSIELHALRLLSRTLGIKGFSAVLICQAVLLIIPACMGAISFAMRVRLLLLIFLIPVLDFSVRHLFLLFREYWLHGAINWDPMDPFWTLSYYAATAVAALGASLCGRGLAWFVCRGMRHDMYGGLQQCAKCSYCLEGNVSGVCPECGNRIQVL